MAQPTVAQQGPYAVEVAPGDYWWCHCGLSKRPPFCDGSHKPTGFTPVKFTMSEAQPNLLLNTDARGVPARQPVTDGRARLAQRQASKIHGRA